MRVYSNHPRTGAYALARHSSRAGTIMGFFHSVTRYTHTLGWRVFKDKLLAAGVIALVLGTVILVSLYGAREFGLYRPAGPAAAAIAPQASQAAAAVPAAANAQAAATQGRQKYSFGSLMLISMVIDIVIFVGLGLFLRWDQKHEEK